MAHEYFRLNEYFSLKQAFLINSSDAEIFMYLIQRIRFGSRKDRRLNGA